MTFSHRSCHKKKLKKNNTLHRLQGVALSSPADCQLCPRAKAKANQEVGVQGTAKEGGFEVVAWLLVTVVLPPPTILGHHWSHSEKKG